MNGGADKAADPFADLQRGIKVAFDVPETHIASAIGYLIGRGPACNSYFDDVAHRFQTLATREAWSLCVELLKIRLAFRARKLRQACNIEEFCKLLESRRF